MGPIWGRQGPGGPHVGPMKFAIWAYTAESRLSITYFSVAQSFQKFCTEHANITDLSEHKRFIISLINKYGALGNFHYDINDKPNNKIM